jgi:hypothetical protein
VVEILVKRDFTQADVRAARLAASEFKKSKATSGADNVLNMTDLKKSVILCDSHARKLHRKHGYRLHPEHSNVIGRCDVCQRYGAARLFLNEADWLVAMKALEKFKRAIEYATIVSG